MKLHCRASGLSDHDKQALITELEDIGEKPSALEDSLLLDYEGPFDQHAMALMLMFEQHGTDHAIMYTEGSIVYGKKATTKPTAD